MCDYVLFFFNITNRFVDNYVLPYYMYIFFENNLLFNTKLDEICMFFLLQFLYNFFKFIVLIYFFIQVSKNYQFMILFLILIETLCQ